jgi:GNAT superfamily N-acetyltransferase
MLVRSTLAERRPPHDVQRIDQMLRNADIIVTARVDGLLVGISRALSDFAYCTYLSDMAVDERFQRQGIHVELIRRTRIAAGVDTSLILLSAPKAEAYYPRIGMEAHDSAWIIRGPFSPPRH